MLTLLALSPSESSSPSSLEVAVTHLKDLASAKSLVLGKAGLEYCLTALSSMVRMSVCIA